MIHLFLHNNSFNNLLTIYSEIPFNLNDKMKHNNYYNYNYNNYIFNISNFFIQNFIMHISK